MILSDEQAARAWIAARPDIDRDAIERLGALAQMLEKENARQNLVSAASLCSIWTRHFADSVQLLDHVPRGTGPWLDLGSGAGFPGLVIAICDPGRDIRLIESRARRITWLDGAIRALDLPHVLVEGQKVETLHTFAASVISARAFAPLKRLIALSERFSTPETCWILPKGRSGRQELREMPLKLQRMFHVEQSITDPESVILVGRGAVRP